MMKGSHSVYQSSFSPIPFDTALPLLDDTLGELGAWREADIRRDEDQPESPRHLMAGLQLVCKVVQTAQLAALRHDADHELHRLHDELTALRQCFAPREEIKAALCKLARCRHQPCQTAVDDEEVLVGAGQLFDELTTRYHAAHHTRGVYGVAVN